LPPQAPAAPTIRCAEPQQFLFSRMNLWSDKKRDPQGWLHRSRL
jgi:hypothetical protein